MPESEEKPLVVIRSLVYNHEPYLRDCLEGFVMQQTSFPFVAVVHDDCSTDGSAAIIREYAEKYPHIIKPVYETENQYSKKDGSLRRAMDEACGKYGAKYIALCEGDDYWTDPHKLQKQVDFLEAHPDYTMVCTDGVFRTPNGDLTDEELVRRDIHRYHATCDITPEDAITLGGYFILTTTLLFRSNLRDDMPPACGKHHAGDYPLQIFATLKGKVRYFHEKTAVYRWGHQGSWTSTINASNTKISRRLTIFRNELAMLDSLDAYSAHKYTNSFKQRKLHSMRRLMSIGREAAQALKAEHRDLLKYSYLAPCIPPEPHDLWHRLLFAAKRLCYYPYFPQTDYSILLLPFLRPFYKTVANKRAIHLGPFNLVTWVSTCPSAKWSWQPKYFPEWQPQSFHFGPFLFHKKC